MIRLLVLDENLHSSITWRTVEVLRENFHSLFAGTVTWDNEFGDWEVFVDGVSVDSGAGVAINGTINGMLEDLRNAGRRVYI